MPEKDKKVTELNIFAISPNLLLQAQALNLKNKVVAQTLPHCNE